MVNITSAHVAAIEVLPRTGSDTSFILCGFAPAGCVRVSLCLWREQTHELVQVYSARWCLGVMFSSSLLESCPLSASQEKISLATAARVLSTLNAFFSSDSPALSSSHVQAPPPELLFLQQQQQQRREEREQEQAGSRNDGGGGGLGGADSDDDSSDSDSGSDEEDSRAANRAAGPKSSQQPGAASMQSPLPPSSGGVGAPQQAVPPPPSEPNKKKRSRRRAPPVENATILEWAAMAWAEMQSTTPSGAQHGGGGGGRGAGGWGTGNGNGQAAAAAALGMTHAGYLKLFQLSRPILGRTYDVIMLDEAQDSNPCIASIVLRETGCARILVGDSHQARETRHAEFLGLRVT